eukprot:6163729-Pleurochrysis_carterae.AAC.2
MAFFRVRSGGTRMHGSRATAEYSLRASGVDCVSPFFSTRSAHYATTAARVRRASWHQGRAGRRGGASSPRRGRPRDAYLKTSAAASTCLRETHGHESRCMHGETSTLLGGKREVHAVQAAPCAKRNNQTSSECAGAWQASAVGEAWASAAHPT